MTLNGIDISGWQPGINLEQVPGDFAIIKATGGVSYISGDCDRQYQQAKKAGKLVGVYHFANDDSRGSSAVAEADFFIKHTLGYHDGKTILVLDFEMQALALGPGWALAFLQRVEQVTGIKPVIYLQGSEASQAKYDPIVKNDNGLWIAHWTLNERVSGYKTPPAAMGSRWPFAILHQYTSQGRLTGWGNDLDLNVFHGDKQTWMKYAAKNGKVESAPAAEGAGKKTIDQLAAEVWANKWGDGQDRINWLTAAGYDAKAVQARVNATAPKTRTYTVAGGDNLSAIATKYGTTWQALYAANKSVIGGNPSLIRPGQVLTIP